MSEIQTVLIVDDDPISIDILSDILREEYYVKAARNGELALNIVRSKSPPDIILLDVVMPGNDGFEICRMIKFDPATSHIPIIFITSQISIEDEIRGLELGAADYILKPFSPPIAKLRVRNQLALHDRKRELKRRVARTTRELEETQEQLIKRLVRAAEYRDNESGQHMIRIGQYTRILAMAAGMGEDEANLLMGAAQLHDIGKTGIPEEILERQEPLDEAGYEVMKEHCEIGASILGGDDSEFLQLATDIALTHHERWNGSGYPKGLQGESIPLAGRIVAIADGFDALTSGRPWKEVWPVDKAVELMKTAAGEYYDPQLVPLFVKSLPDILKIKEQYAES